jgi:PTS system cellobiose-specific IIB component
MSSSLLVNRMREAAASIGYECRISAHSIGAVKSLSQEADVVLIGRQVGYLIASVRASCLALAESSFPRTTGEWLV